jgi:hypothetical protein
LRPENVIICHPSSIPCFLKFAALLLCPAGEASLFTLSSRNAMVQMLGSRGPRVVAASIDSKRDLEQQLKACCEAFIMGLTKAAVEPMLGFITKVTAVRLAAGSNAALAKPLKEQVRLA